MPMSRHGRASSKKRGVVIRQVDIPRKPTATLDLDDLQTKKSPQKTKTRRCLAYASNAVGTINPVCADNENSRMTPAR